MPSFLKRLYAPEHMISDSQRSGEIPPAREMYANALRMAWPSITESVLVGLTGMVDTMMVGGLGAYAIAAVGLTNQPRMIVMALFMALNVGVTAVISRRFGQEDREGANSCLRQVLLAGALLSILACAAGYLFARPLLNFAGAQPDTIGPAVSYFRIIMFGIPATVLTLTINAAQRGSGNTRIALYTNIMANLVNIVFDWFLIEGRWGFPRLEVAGDAIATVLGNYVALGLAVYSIMKPGSFLHLRFKDSFRPRADMFAVLFRVSGSAALEQVFLRVGFFTYVMIVANLGTTDYATHQIAMHILTLSFCFGDGLSVAASALVGQSLGRERPDMAILYGKVSQRIGMCISALLAIMFLTAHRPLIGLFTDEEPIIAVASGIVMFMALITTGQISQVVFSGCLRGAGDTLFVAVASMISIALIRPLLSWYLCYPAGFGLMGAWYGLLVDQYLRLAICGLRFSKGRWTKIRV